MKFIDNVELMKILTEEMKVDQEGAVEILARCSVEPKMKICKTCKWRVKILFDKDQCGRPDLLNKITGKSWESCENERSYSHNHCSSDGKFWEPKETQDKTESWL